MLQDMRRVQDITRHYNALQGLPLVIVGTTFMFVNIWRMWLAPHGQPLAEALTVIVALIVISAFLGLSVLAKMYYLRTFGHVNTARRDVGPMFLKNAGFFILGFLGDSIDTAIHPAISMVTLFLGVGFFIYWWMMKRSQAYYFIFSLLLFITSLLPVLRINTIFHTPTWIVGTDPYWGFVGLMIGVIFIISGFLDHLFLLRSFSAISRNFSAVGKQVE